MARAVRGKFDQVIFCHPRPSSHDQCSNVVHSFPITSKFTVFGRQKHQRKRVHQSFGEAKSRAFWFRGRAG